MVTKSLRRYHTYQKEDYDCGPTCIGIAANFLGVKYKNFEEIKKLCGTRPKTGTTDRGMKNALDRLKIKNKQNPFIGDEEKSIELLDKTLNGENLFIMRTLTREIKHWIIAYGKSKHYYLISDPWLGSIKYNLKQILSVWKPRNFYGFIVLGRKS